jgi:putative transposase
MLSVWAVCAALGLARATFYRRQQFGPHQARRSPPRTLSGDERATVLATLNADRFCDLAPAQVYATLLDEQQYLCSERTMYRILAENAQVRERRAQSRQIKYAAPQLLA